MSKSKQPRSLRGTSTKPASHQGDQTRIALASAAFVAVSAASFHVHAEEKVTNLEGVTVEETKTAPGANPNAEPDAPYKINRSGNSKFTEPLLNTSKVITVIGKEQLEDANTTSLKDLMRTEPGITIGTGEGGNALGDRFFIRGFDARGDMFVDGMRDPGSTVREVFATEQVEIAKGPGSTFGGRGTTGGAVNSVSKTPQDENFTRATVQVGNDNRATLDTNRVINDKLSVRANVMVHDGDISGNEDRYDKRKGLALSAEYKATDKTSLMLDLYHLDGENMPDFGVPWDTANNRPYKVDTGNFYGLNGRDFQETSANIVTGTLSHDFSPNTRLVSKIRTGETTNDYIVGVPYAFGRGGANPAPGNTFSNPKDASYTNKFVGNNTQITHEKYVNGIEHVITAGIDLSKEEVVKGRYSINGWNGVELNIENPDNNTGSGTVVRRSTGDATTEAETSSLYIMDTAKLNDKWQLFGGLRYDKYSIETELTDYRSGAVTGTATIDKGFTNGHLGVVYKPKENGTVYAAYSTSSNLPGEVYDSASIASYGGLTQDMSSFEPEKNTNIEIGTKWEVADGKLMLGGALYKMSKDKKVEAPRGGTPDQTGAVDITGIELTASGNLTPKLNVAAGISHMDTEITKSYNPSNVGLKLANVAEQSASLQLKYQATPKLALGGSFIRTGSITGGGFAATGNTLDASNRVDLSAEYKFSKNLSGQVNVKNAFDENIYDALYTHARAFTFTSPGRTVNASLTYDF